MRRFRERERVRMDVVFVTREVMREIDTYL